MKVDFKTIVSQVVFLGLGLLAGYFLFNGNNVQEHVHVEKTEQNPVAEGAIFTCSMHPQIRQHEPGICPICEMDLIPLESNVADDPKVLQMTETAVALANIQTTVVGETSGSSAKTIRLSGKIQADERLASSQVAHVSGRIEKLYVSFTGAEIVQGQKLADLYAPELITAQQELLEAKKLADINPGLLEAARNKLRFLKIGESMIRNVEEQGRIQESFTLYADSDGIVSKRKVSVGDYVKKGEPLFDMINLGKVWILFDAYEDDLVNINVGNKIEFNTPAIPGKMFKTKITFIDPIVNPETRVTAVRAEMKNVNMLLKPEMFVAGILKNSAAGKSALTVPKSAVLWTGKRSVVFVKVPDMEIPSFKFREIELGEAMGDSYKITSGLEAGEEVVTNGSFTIDAAAQLNNQQSMMNKDVVIKKDGVEILPDFKAAIPLAFKQQLGNVLDGYILLKDALVATDFKAAIPAATAFEKKLEAVDMSLLNGEAHIYWMDQLQVMKTHGSKIKTTEDVEKQRKQFSFVSNALINSLKVFGTENKSLFVQHCPMAFGNKGADWLANEAAIQNPYFGDKMMKCGIVKLNFGEDDY